MVRMIELKIITSGAQHLNFFEHAGEVTSPKFDLRDLLCELNIGEFTSSNGKHFLVLVISCIIG